MSMNIRITPTIKKKTKTKEVYVVLNRIDHRVDSVRSNLKKVESMVKKNRNLMYEAHTVQS